MSDKASPTKGALLHARRVISERAWELEQRLKSGDLDGDSRSDFKLAISELDDVANWLAKCADSAPLRKVPS